MSFKYIQWIFAVLLFCALGCTTYAETQTNDDKFVQYEKRSSRKGSRSRNNQGQYFEDLKKTEQDKKRMDVEYSVLSSGSSKSLESRIIRSRAALHSLKYTLDKSIIELLEDINFNEQAVIIANAGTFSTGGYSIVLDSGILEDDVLSLNFAVLSPTPDTMVTQAFTYPYTIVAVDVDRSVEIKMLIIGASKRDSAFE